MRVSYLSQYEGERAEELHTLSIVSIRPEAPDALQLQLFNLSHLSQHTINNALKTDLKRVNLKEKLRQNVYYFILLSS